MITPKKSLGQNFLIDKNISAKIVGALNIQPDDLMLEIGPGTGALTEILLQSDTTLIVVDTDLRAVELLMNKFPPNKYPKLKIIHSDIRDINLKDILEQNNKQKIKIIGNIPYNISGDICFWMFESAQLIDSCVMMFQKEVAKRLSAPIRTKDYGILTLAMNMTGNSKILFDVSPSCFYPKPEVTSSVVFMNFHDEKKSEEEYKTILQIVKAAFNQRRKTLRNSLRNLIEKGSQSKIDDFIIKNEMTLLFSKRAEELSLEDFNYLAARIKKFKSEKSSKI